MVGKEDEVSVPTMTLSHSQLSASSFWSDPDSDFGDANMVTGFPPLFPRQNTRASIFWTEKWQRPPGAVETARFIDMVPT